MRALSILGESARIVHPVAGDFDLSGERDVVDAVVGVIRRHPMREEDLVRALAIWSAGQVSQALDQLEADGRARVVERYGHRFWTAKTARYARDGSRD
jgi:hypothetical protein